MRTIMRVRRMPRRGIVLSLSANGTARLIFRGDRSGFAGMLETDGGETFSVSGKLTKDSPDPSSSSEPYIMDILIVEGDTGSSFKLDHVEVFADGPKVTIRNPAISFSTTKRFIGAKADVVIHQYLKPGMIDDDDKEVFVGPMELCILAKEIFKESIRRESVCEQDVILEQSDDFLA
ncbi:unnamed protein product [Haemonchus placei]|uniref:SpoIID domain-containing protein n=1 Tax=Haemonchus placei TaxID=6290 RepID=A0A0N4WSC8_HAEPC|nr:unnamed protein product [Haemonchus placei]